MASKQLPFDIYVQILHQLPISAQTDESPKTLAACLGANSLLRRAASLAAVWKPHYHARYTIGVPDNERLRWRTFGQDWMSLYMQRASLDRQALRILDDIVAERGGRRERASFVASTFSYDVWNALVAETQCPIPIQGDADGARHAVPRRFWAQSLLGTIARTHAVRTWCSIGDEQLHDADTLEAAIACLSSYFGHPPMEVGHPLSASLRSGSLPKVSSQLDALTHRCRLYLTDKRIMAVPAEFNRNEGMLCDISTSICQFLRESGFEVGEQAQPNAFNTSFPHLFLSTHKNTNSMSLVYVFVCLARRMGINAAPVDCPGRVLAIVSSPEPSISDIIVDVCTTQSTAISSYLGDVPPVLVDAGIVSSLAPQSIRPASVASSIARALKNVPSSFSIIQSLQGIPEQDFQAASYVEFAVNLIFMRDGRYLVDVMKHLSRFPLDLLPVMTDTLAPRLEPSMRKQLLAGCDVAREVQDKAVATVTLRSELSIPVRHFVGTVFEHGRYGYIGYVYGWEPCCKASRLATSQASRPCGRHRPFYHVFSPNGPVQYVAEEAIIPTTVEPDAFHDLLKRTPEAGQYFEGLVREHGRARLLPSPELRCAYPEDEAVGERWITQGMML